MDSQVQRWQIKFLPVSKTGVSSCLVKDHLGEFVKYEDAQAEIYKWKTLLTERCSNSTIPRNIEIMRMVHDSKDTYKP